METHRTGLRRIPFWKWTGLFAAAGSASTLGCFLYLSVTHAMPNALIYTLWPSFPVMWLLFSPAPISVWAELIVLLVSIALNAAIYSGVGAALWGFAATAVWKRARR